MGRSRTYIGKEVKNMLITIGSVTTAARLARLLEKNTGYPASVVHTPSSINKGGCSYSVRFNESMLNKAKEIIKDYRVPVKRFYSENMKNGKRVYNDLSG